jgi:glycine cleavage system H protein
MGDPGNIPPELLYYKQHEWTRVEGDLVVVGITDYAQNSLHEITFVELAEAGTTVEFGEEIGLVESMKASNELYTPIAGEIVEVNADLEDSPELVNEDPYGKGWMIKVKPSNLDGDLGSLMSPDEYKEFCAGL